MSRRQAWTFRLGRVLGTYSNEFQKEEQMTIVLTAHYLNEADDADKIYIVDHGQVIAQGSADQIKGNYVEMSYGF